MTTISGMPSSHAESVLERLHEQYLRGLDCDVILTAVDHLEENDSQTPETNSSRKDIWKDLSCHKIVLRAISSFFDRIFRNKFTHDKLKVDDKVEGTLIENEKDNGVLLQITFHEISLHSIETLVNFGYTGNVAIETVSLSRAIEDFKVLNVRAIIDKLESRLEEDLSFANCIPNLIISYALDRKEKYRIIMTFILEEFFRGFKSADQVDGSWRNFLEADLPLPEMIDKIKEVLQSEVSDGKQVVSEYSRLLNIIISLIDCRCISAEKERELVAFLVTKKRKQCSIHLQNIQMYCCTDDEEICVECLTDGHDKHSIQHVNIAKYQKLASCWKNIDLELENVKESSRDRIIELDSLTEKIITEKSRDLRILESCAEIKPKLNKLSNIFESGKLEFNDKDVFALEQFVVVLEKETRRSKEDYLRAKQISDDLLVIMQKRCSSCASIVHTNLEIDTFEDLEDIDLDQPLSITNCITILKRSKKLGNQQLYEEAFNFIGENFIDVVKEAGDSFYCRMNHLMLENLLKRDILKVKSEDEVVLIVKEWIDFDFRLRKRFATQLFRQVRFGCVSERLLKEIEANPSHIIMMDEESKKLVKEAIAGACNHCPRGNNKILAFGDDGQCLLYDSVKNLWEELPAQNNGSFFSAVLVAENIFIIGGQVNNGSHSKVSIYNVNTKAWKDGPNLPGIRFAMGTCVSSKNSIYVVGGFGGLKLNSVEMLNCDENGEPIGGWQTLPPMRTARYFFEAAIVDDTVYAIGGYPDIATMEMFDPKVNRWSDCKSMSQGNYNHAVSTYNGEIYVFGADRFCEKYNPVTNTWTAIAALNTEANCRGSAVLHDKIYLIGGYDCTETDIYDVKTNRWSNGQPMPKQIGCTKCVFLN